MNYASEGTTITGHYGTVLTPGTVTGTGVDFSPTYEPSVKAVASLGAVTAGTVVVDVQGGTAVSSGYTSLGTITAGGAAAGTQSYEVNVTNPYRYLRAVSAITGGTVSGVGVSFVAKRRTVE